MFLAQHIRTLSTTSYIISGPGEKVKRWSFSSFSKKKEFQDSRALNQAQNPSKAYAGHTHEAGPNPKNVVGFMKP